MKKQDTSVNDYWEVRRDGVPLAGGPKSTFPNAEERKSLRSDGLKIYVEGKLFREEKVMDYWHFDEELFTQKFIVNPQRHYPLRIEPKKWPDIKLIGKAMVRGWAVPCKYYGTPPRGLEKRLWYYIFPGIPGGSAYEAIASVLLEGAVLIRRAENEKRKNTIDGIISFHESRRNNLQI